MHRKTVGFLGVLVLIMVGCTSQAQLQAPAAAVISSTATATLPLSAIPLMSGPTATPVIPPLQIRLSVDSSVPSGLQEKLVLPAGARLAGPGEVGEVRLRALGSNDASPAEATWFFALVAPFPTILDGVRLEDVRQAWSGGLLDTFQRQPLLVSPETEAAFSGIWGPPSQIGVKIVPENQLLSQAWARVGASWDLAAAGWAIVPFERLEPRWKVLRVDGYSLLDKGLDVQAYPLAVRFGLVGESAAVKAVTSGDFAMPLTNRDPQKMTVLAMTGVTALARGTAEKMDAFGVDYPAQKIGDWLREADITHISNEVSFFENCPPAAKRDPRFCSDPNYIGLLETIGTDVVELTGNHLLDWGAAPFERTLVLYQKEGWKVYGGGLNLQKAQQAITMEDHGNKIAFIGCNPAGPEKDWATKTSPGSASCDFDKMKAEVTRLRQEGYLVVATFQHVEVCSMEPHLTQKADFQKMLQAGATIVSGSQAHCPQAIAIQNDQFVHYGLGNLFFDQMDAAARREFIDQHVFYQGRYVSTILLTAMLEDGAQPRPMNEKERQKLLEEIFRASGWLK